MKQRLIDNYLSLQSKVRAISNKDWVRAHGYHWELRMERIGIILKSRYSYDVSEIELKKRGALDLQHPTETEVLRARWEREATQA